MLLMEYKHWSRLGEHARIWAYLPNSWLKGSPEDPSIKLFNALVFTLSLCVLFYGFAQTKYRMTGLLLVALINITPFFIFEVYVNMNIFGLMGSVLFLCLGLLAPSLLGEKRSFSKMAILVLLAAWVVGVATEMRNEITVVFLSLLLMVLFIGKQKLWQKALLLVVVILGFWSSKEMVRTHFAKKWAIS